MEDEAYLWVLTRYDHLNPVHAHLLTNPAYWVWWSYRAYAEWRRRLECVAYDDRLVAWDGAFGGTDAARAYRRFVRAGIDKPPGSPLRQTQHGRLLGSDAFVERVANFHPGNPPTEQRRESRRLAGAEPAPSL